MAIPKGMYGRIAGRSSLALKSGVIIGGGVLDSDFRDECAVIITVVSPNPYKIKAGDRVAQLVIEKLGEVEVLECTDLDETDRKGGFGSTGV